jgi:hypothetical protein
MFSSLSDVRFCLSDGKSWIFLVPKNEKNTLTFYASPVCFQQKTENLAHHKLSLSTLVSIIQEWVGLSVVSLRIYFSKLF